MPTYQLRFDFPDTSPFDRSDWHWQAMGEVILPIVTHHSLERWYIGRYDRECFVRSKCLVLRYEKDRLPESSLPRPPDGHEAFDIVGHLGSAQFFGQNSRAPLGQTQRGQRIFSLLTAASLLALDQLSHKVSGYWVLEANADRLNNAFGMGLESVLHLVGNTMGVPVGVVTLDEKETAQRRLSSPLLTLQRAAWSGAYREGMPIHQLLF